MEIKIPYYEDNSRVSKSSMMWFLKSPRYFRDKLDGKIPNDLTPAMENGTMRHAYLLQYNEFRKLYRILDFVVPTSANQKQFCLDYISSKANKPILKAAEAFKTNYVTNGKSEEDIAAKGLEMALKLKQYIKWLRTKDSEQKTMTWSQFNSLKIMKENVQLHKLAKELLFNNGDSPSFITNNEFHINWDCKTKDGKTVACKSLLDRFVIDLDNKVIKLIDIKTTMSSADFADSFNKYDYGMQMAFYWMAIYWYVTNELKLNVEDFKNETYIITIENGTNQVRVLSVPDSIIFSKTEQIQQIITDIDWHINSNLWDYSKEYYEGDGAESLLYDIK